MSSRIPVTAVFAAAGFAIAYAAGAPVWLAVAVGVVAAAAAWRLNRTP